MKHGSLFSGIGGFEEGAVRTGIENVWSCEIDEWNRKLLKQNYGTYQYSDIREMRNPEYVDIITGGFPCQDISTSGKGEGITGSRSGLWKEYRRIVGEVRPKYIIIENSPALLFRGFEQVLCDLSEIGYMCEWRCLCADEFGADHKRERFYGVAYPDGIGYQALLQQLKVNHKKEKRWKADKPMLIPANEWMDRSEDSFIIRRGNGVRHISHRIKGLGNSIYVPIAESIFQAIKKVEHV